MKQYRYPGTKPFTTEQAHIFFGRKQDGEDLLRLIRNEQLVVLYGKSGLGKSSLLNAAVVPDMQREGSFTVLPVRFGAWTEGKKDTPANLAKQTIAKGFADESLLDELVPYDNSLWYFTKNRQLNGGGDRLLLLFDQFEELFSYPEAAIAEFKRELTELLKADVPQRFRQALEKNAPSADSHASLHRPLEVKIVLAIRSDRMHLLDRLKDYLPNVLRHCFELKALLPGDAKDAILLPAQAPGGFQTEPFDYTPAALHKLLAFLKDPQDGRVEGILLQMLCEHYERRLVAEQGLRLLDTPDIGDPAQVVKKYYEEKIASLPQPQQLPARRLIEDGLVSEGEAMRLSLHEQYILHEFGVDKVLLERLVDSRLLRSEPFLRGGYTYELSHDRLVPPVLAARGLRREEDAKREAEQQRLELQKTQRRLRIVRALLVAAVIALGFAGWQYLEAKRATERAEIAKDNALQSDSLAQAAEKQALAKAKEAQVAKDTAEERKIVADLATLEAKRQEELAKTNLTKATQANASTVELLLENADRDILKLDYEAALQKLKAAASLGALKPEVANAYLEIAFWHGEAGNTLRATALLDSAAALVNKKLDAGQSFRETFEAYDQDVYKKLMERYYPVMVKVEGGPFDMGCDRNIDSNCESDETLHKQEVSSFQMAKYETTWWQYYLFCKATGHEYKSPGWGTDGDNPAVNVSWFDAVAYCNWVSRQLGMKEAIGKDSEGRDTVNLRSGYRLPTEAEWEYAAKGGKNPDNTVYSGSNELAEVGWFSGNSGSRTQPAGKKKANALGLHDMSGNAYEWCWDWKADYPEDFQPNYKGPESGSFRVLRGGSWSVNDSYCRVSGRNDYFPGYWYSYDGFRCARVF